MLELNVLAFFNYNNILLFANLYNYDYTNYDYTNYDYIR